MKAFTDLSRVMSKDLAYNSEGKKKFHTKARAALRAVAKGLGLPNQAFKISSNQAGIACSGEAGLKHERFEISISQRFGGDRSQVLFRARQGNHTGTNNTCSAIELGQDRVMKQIRNWLEA